MVEQGKAISCRPVLVVEEAGVPGENHRPWASNCVLIFPPFNSFHRFLAHKCTEDYKELKSFSVGQGILRRLVICDQADFVGEQTDTGGCMSNPRPSVGRGRARGRLRQDGSPGISPVGLRNTDVTQSDVPRVVPKAADYIPPRPVSGTEESRLKRNQRCKDRKPEVQLYVPKGRRSQDSINETPSSHSYSPENHTCPSEQFSYRQDTNSIQTVEDTQTVKDTTYTRHNKQRTLNDSDIKPQHQEHTRSENDKPTQNTSRQRRIRTNQVYIPPGRRKEVDKSESQAPDQSFHKEQRNNSYDGMHREALCAPDLTRGGVKSEELKTRSDIEVWAVDDSVGDISNNRVQEPVNRNEEECEKWEENTEENYLCSGALNSVDDNKQNCQECDNGNFLNRNTSSEKEPLNAHKQDVKTNETVEEYHSSRLQSDQIDKNGKLPDKVTALNKNLTLQNRDCKSTTLSSENYGITHNTQQVTENLSENSEDLSVDTSGNTSGHHIPINAELICSTVDNSVKFGSDIDNKFHQCEDNIPQHLPVDDVTTCSLSLDSRVHHDSQSNVPSVVNKKYDHSSNDTVISDTVNSIDDVNIHVSMLKLEINESSQRQNVIKNEENNAISENNENVIKNEENSAIKENNEVILDTDDQEPCLNTRSECTKCEALDSTLSNVSECTEQIKEKSSVSHELSESNLHNSAKCNMKDTTIVASGSHILDTVQSSGSHILDTVQSSGSHILDTVQSHLHDSHFQETSISHQHDTSKCNAYDTSYSKDDRTLMCGKDDGSLSSGCTTDILHSNDQPVCQRDDTSLPTDCTNDTLDSNDQPVCQRDDTSLTSDCTNDTLDSNDQPLSAGYDTSLPTDCTNDTLDSNDQPLSVGYDTSLPTDCIIDTLDSNDQPACWRDDIPLSTDCTNDQLLSMSENLSHIHNTLCEDNSSVSEKDDTSICNNLPHTHDTSKSNENIKSESHESIVLECTTNVTLDSNNDKFQSNIKRGSGETSSHRHGSGRKNAIEEKTDKLNTSDSAKDRKIKIKTKSEISGTDKEEKVKRTVKKKTVKIKKKLKQKLENNLESSNSTQEEGNQSTTSTDKVTKSSDNSDEDDSWDKMFDDDGDCLDPNSLKELTGNVGKVTVKKPIINYLNYQPKEPDLDYEGMNHVIEIYDFSPEMKTEDLLSAFNQFKSKGFDIKWVDDTHALGVFSSVIAANEALQFPHPLLKVRPLSQACRESKLKAKRAVEFLQPYKARPETTAVVARRMLTGALGLKPKVSKEQREKEREEKHKLKEAKDKKKKERQQKVDIWEGIVHPEENT